MLPVIQVGSLAIQTPGLMLLAGLWLGLSLAEKNAAKHKVNAEDLYNLVFSMLIAGILSARISYILRFPSAFTANPISMISLNPDLLDPWVGGAVAAFAGFYFGQRKQLRLWETLDALTPLLAMMMVTFALANLASGAGFGTPTELPWAIELWGEARHPSQIYEALGALGILLFLWFSRHRKRAAGEMFLTFLTLSSGARLFFEAFRGDSLLIASGLRVGQILAWLMLAIGLWGLSRRKNRIQ